MKKIVDRIELLEKGSIVAKEVRILLVDDDEDAEVIMATDRSSTGFAGEYVIVHLVKGRWEDRDDGTWWVRPDGSVDASRGRMNRLLS